ncbi:MAG: Fic family protein [Bacteroidales bacterium]|nr:Fic family protein [Bacteroidales bacterium]
MYKPPFTISSEAINKIAEISRLIERYAIRLEKEDGLRLRKANRIKTIHSSLAIEGNKLSVDEVRDILEGKNVVAPIREIQEVKNAIRTYEMYPSLDAFKEKDLLKAHGQMMEAIIDNPGHYRSSGVGVFSEKGLVHMAPPANMVPSLMGNLFEWLKHSKDHLLIRSCVFHYEFEFIHPFADGNGRTGRLWQSLILGKLHPFFEHLPVENMVFDNQQAYYDAITASTKAGDSGPFIDFMLGEILNTLKAHQGEELKKVPNKVRTLYPGIADGAWDVLAYLKKNNNASATVLGEKLGISDRMVRKHLAVLKEAGLIMRVGSNKTGYWEVKK